MKNHGVKKPRSTGTACRVFQRKLLKMHGVVWLGRTPSMFGVHFRTDAKIPKLSSPVCQTTRRFSPTREAYNTFLADAGADSRVVAVRGLATFIQATAGAVFCHVWSLVCT